MKEAFRYVRLFVLYFLLCVCIHVFFSHTISIESFSLIRFHSFSSSGLADVVEMILRGEKERERMSILYIVVE